MAPLPQQQPQAQAAGLGGSRTVAENHPPQATKPPINATHDLDSAKARYVAAWNAMADRIGAARADLADLTDRASAALEAVVRRDLWQGAFAGIEASPWARSKVQRGDEAWSFAALVENPAMIERLGG